MDRPAPRRDAPEAVAAPASAPPHLLAADAEAAALQRGARREERLRPLLERLVAATIPLDNGRSAAAATAAYAAWVPGQRSILVRRGEGFRCALVLAWEECRGEGAIESQGLTVVAGEDGLVRTLPAGWDPSLDHPGLAQRITMALPAATFESPGLPLCPNSKWLAGLARQSGLALAARVESALCGTARARTAEEAARLDALRARGRAIAFLRGRFEPDSAHDRMRLWAIIHGDPALARLVPEPGCACDERALGRHARRAAAIALRLARTAGTLPHVLRRRAAARQRRHLASALLTFRAFLDPEPVSTLARAALWSSELYNYYAGLTAGRRCPEVGARRRAAAARFPLLAGMLHQDPALSRWIDRGGDPAEALAAVHGWDPAVAARFAGVNWQRCGRLPLWRAPYIVAAAGRLPAESIDLSGRSGGAALVATVEAGLEMTRLTGQPVGDWCRACQGEGSPVRYPNEAAAWLIHSATRQLLVPIAWRMMRAADPHAALDAERPLRAVVGGAWSAAMTYDPSLDPPARPLIDAPVPPLVLGGRGPAALEAAALALGPAPTLPVRPSAPALRMPWLPPPHVTPDGVVAFVATPADARAAGAGVRDEFTDQHLAIALLGAAGGPWRAAFLVEARADGALRHRRCLWGACDAVPRWRPVLLARLADLAGPSGREARTAIAEGVATVERDLARWRAVQFIGYDPSDTAVLESIYAWIRTALPHGADAPHLGAWVLVSGAAAVLSAAIARRGGA